jgi:protein-tyrosine phosphatase
VVTGGFGSGPATKIAPGLWQGGFPINPEEVAQSGFDALVFAAREYQPVGGEERELFPGVEVLAVPLDDDGETGPTAEEIRQIGPVVLKIVELVSSGKRVLVTCREGRNRSGLLVALTLAALFHVSGTEAAEHVRSKRARALTNAGFSDFLDRIDLR